MDSLLYSPALRRRAALAAGAWLAMRWPLAAAAGGGTAAAPDGTGGPLRLATAWRAKRAGAAAPADRVGIITVDWQAGRIEIAAEVPVPTRAHGLLALADGGFVAVANRPGRWLLRCDARGRVERLRSIDDEQPRRTLNGHVVASAEEDWLYGTETDTTTGEGWIGVRDARTLARVHAFPAGGIDPHQLLLAPDGTLVVAIGGIVRDAGGRKIELARMDPALVRLEPAGGRVAGRWQLDDRRLSIRHLAWAHGAAGAAAMPLLGVALQAEHDTGEARRQAPTLAVWDGGSLRAATGDASGEGYAGDIAAGPLGGFVVSAQKAGRGLWWHPARPDRLALVAELTEPGALATLDAGAGVLIGAGRGVARWHARSAPAMLRWPAAMAPDNHGVLLHAAS